MDQDIISKFWAAPDDALFTREEVAKVRRCSPAKMAREAWLGTGIPMLKDNGRALHRKRAVVSYLNGLNAEAGASC